MAVNLLLRSDAGRQLRAVNRIRTVGRKTGCSFVCGKENPGKDPQEIFLQAYRSGSPLLCVFYVFYAACAAFTHPSGRDILFKYR
jgi:hypothetical protein